MSLTKVDNQQPREHATPCPSCQAPLHLVELTPTTVNHILFSQIICVHERPIICAKCGAYWAMGIAEANIAYCLLPSAPPAQIVTPDSGRVKMH